MLRQVTKIKGQNTGVYLKESHYFYYHNRLRAFSGGDGGEHNFHVMVQSGYGIMRRDGATRL